MENNTTYVRQGGFKIFCRIDRNYQDVQVINEVISSDCYELDEFNEQTKAIGFIPEVILDIGGHIGTFGLLAKKYWPKAKLIAVEPVKENAELYEKNIFENFGEKPIIVNKAISYSGKKLLACAARTTGGFTLTKPEEAELYINSHYRELNDTLECETTTIEEIFKEHNIERIDFTKWDCEGGEIDAFANMEDETARKFNFMVGEIHYSDSDMPYLMSTPITRERFWLSTRRKFPHLNFSYPSSIGVGTQFQAWPKETR